MYKDCQRMQKKKGIDDPEMCVKISKLADSYLTYVSCNDKFNNYHVKTNPVSETTRKMAKFGQAVSPDLRSQLFLVVLLLRHLQSEDGFAKLVSLNLTIAIIHRGPIWMCARHHCLIEAKTINARKTTVTS